MDGERMKEQIIKAPAKINLALDVTGRREDGYHLMRMINFSADLEDTLIIKPGAGLSLTCDTPGVPTDGSNLVIKAARCLQNACGVDRGASLQLQKKIPMQAGLAGGSADGAAALVGLNRFWKLGLSEAELLSLGAQIGADIPYCCVNRPALVEGIGEKVTPLQKFPSLYILGVKPSADISTPWAFSQLDRCSDRTHPDIGAVLKALEDGNDQALAAQAGNAFEQVVFPLYPGVKSIRDQMLKSGARFAVMSGSGSTMIGYFDSVEAAEAARDRFDNGSNVMFVTKCEPKIIEEK